MRAGCLGPTVKDHPLFNVMFGDSDSVMSILRRTRPSVFMSEQVSGFSKPWQKGSDHSPKSDLVEEVMCIQRPDGSQHFKASAVLSLNSSTFVRGSRPRCPSLHVGVEQQFLASVSTVRSTVGGVSDTGGLD